MLSEHGDCGLRRSPDRPQERHIGRQGLPWCLHQDELLVVYRLSHGSSGLTPETARKEAKVENCKKLHDKKSCFASIALFLFLLVLHNRVTFCVSAFLCF